MKKIFLSLILLLASTAYAQQVDIKKKEKTDSLIQSLNKWYKHELDLYERPETYPSNLLTSGETNAWVITHKEQLKELGAEVIWNENKKQYFLKPR